MPEQAETRRKGDAVYGLWLDRAQMLGLFINKVGIPTIFFMIVMFLVVGVATGFVKNPVASADAMTAVQNELKEHRENANIKTDAQIVALKKINRQLRLLTCEHRPTANEKITCLARGGDDQNGNGN